MLYIEVTAKVRELILVRCLANAWDSLLRRLDLYIRYILIFGIESSRCFPSRKVDHTLHFIDLVREAFARNPAAYNDFFHTLKLYESNA